jgi:dienelactone hydrolase/DNA-directed RNA polymerase subunit RPC12/RpoP
MPSEVQCPQCGHEFLPPWSARVGQRVECPRCGAMIASTARDRSRAPDGQRPTPGGGNRMLAGGLLGCGALLLLCCGGVVAIGWWAASPTAFPEQKEDYAQARKNFQTKLVRQAAAPQVWHRQVPPAGVTEINYTSGNLGLKAWVNPPPAADARRPAVLFLHGGFAFDEEDWEQAQPFRDAGFVVMTPMLRGENGLPGAYSMFYNEVDDALAAAETLAQQPGVDGNRLYVAGHSAGGTVALLSAMTSPRFRAAASFSGSPDQVVWARGQAELVPFDPEDRREFQMRSPLAYPRSFKCPVRLYYGNEEFFFSLSTPKLAQAATAANLDVQAVQVPGDHMTAVEPAMRQAVAFFRQK